MTNFGNEDFLFCPSESYDWNVTATKSDSPDASHTIDSCLKFLRTSEISDLPEAVLFNQKIRMTCSLVVGAVHLEQVIGHFFLQMFVHCKELRGTFNRSYQCRGQGN